MKSRMLLVTLLLVLLPCLQGRATERVWMHCDRSLYAAGEIVWLRGWVWEDDRDDAAAEMPTSKFLYVELLRDGMGSVEQRIKLKERSGMFFGQLELPDDLDSGWYTLRAYTRAQKDWPAEALFHTQLLIRGSGTLDALCAIPSVAAGNETPAHEISVALTPAADGHLSVTLTDDDGQPVAGNFALSLARRGYAEFDFQPYPAPAAINDTFQEGEREYAQELDFRVKSVRNRLPDQYGIAIMSQDIGYYLSTDIDGDRSVKGEEGQPFRIPDLDFPEGTIFTVHTTGSSLVFPVAEEASFAAPFDYGPTYPAREAARDTAHLRERFEETLALLPADDTLRASSITAERKSSTYRPERMVGPYSNVFEWRQVKLRDELQKYDDIDLMTYIAANWPSFVCTSGDGLSAGRSLYTTRSGSVTQRVVVSHGQAQYNNAANYSPVGLYIDGTRMDDWTEAASMTVRNVQNLYVLRGAEAALYKEAAVVLLERRHFDRQMMAEVRNNERKTTIGLLPLGWQRPKSFNSIPIRSGREGTLYWNPCIRTNTAGHADLTLPERPENGGYLRIEGRTLDGRWFSTVQIIE